MAIAKQIAENATFAILARVAMIFCAAAVTFIGWVGNNYFTSQQTKMDQFNAHIETVATSLNKRDDDINIAVSSLGTRVSVIEAAQANNNYGSDLRDMRATVQQLATQVAAVNATLQQMKDDQHNRSPIN